MNAKTPLAPEILVHRLGDYLVKSKLLTAEGLEQALSYQRARREAGQSILLGQALVELNLISRSALDHAITEQVIRLRTALEESNQQLERRVRERTAELQEALEKLSTVNQLKSNIVSNISHELRTPLTHIEGYLALLSNHDLGPLNDEQQRAVEVLMRSTERLEHLIEDLILFSMTERNEVTLRLQPTNLRQILPPAIEAEINKARDRNVQFDFICPNNLPVVESDSEKISWVIKQLLDNAVKFTPPGGRVRLQLESQDRLVRVIVEDTGIGIPAERINEIFEPFYQLDGSSTRKYGGTGLGLDLVQKIVSAHGSRVHVTSEINKGSRFEFILKALPEQP